MIKFELEPYKKNIDDEELIADLRHVASELKTDSLTQQEYKKHGKFGVSIFYNRFGSWSNALAKAGLKNGKSRTKIIIEDEELITDLKQVSFELKNDSVTRDEYNRYGKFHSATLEDRFGSWIKAKEKAGLKRREHPSISDEEYFKNLEDVWIKLGRQPHFSDMKIPFSKYSGSGYVHNFGTWRKALERFIEYVNKEEKTTIEGENSINIEVNKLPLTPIIEYPKKELVSEFLDKTPSDKSPKSSQRSINKHQTKREVNDRLRFRVMKRDNFKCQYCGRSPATNSKIILHVDHIIPWSKGGETTFENLRTLCSNCNIGKGNLE
ncbi:MAG: HNH endonuclease [Planctomycetes bacterium]|uniref:homing endonuclease associated repeat-containing protein n=1 Tax=Candidatus Wunengus sp. YC65 TaxID=3367701 RepID=UPI001D950D06|nr:HNH endonuclease [Planctomycetota bacterium]